MCIAFVRGTWKLFSLLYLQPRFYFFIFRKNHTKTFEMVVKKKKKKTHTHTQTPTKFFERAIVQLANSNLDFDISFNQIQ